MEGTNHIVFVQVLYEYYYCVLHLVYVRLAILFYSSSTILRQIRYSLDAVPLPCYTFSTSVYNAASFFFSLFPEYSLYAKSIHKEHRNGKKVNHAFSKFSISDYVFTNDATRTSQKISHKSELLKFVKCPHCMTFNKRNT